MVSGGPEGGCLLLMGRRARLFAQQRGGNARSGPEWRPRGGCLLLMGRRARLFAQQRGRAEATLNRAPKALRVHRLARPRWREPEARARAASVSAQSVCATARTTTASHRVRPRITGRQQSS